MPSADQAKAWVILIMTYVVAIGEFPHIIVGASEILYLVFAGEASWTEFALRFGLPTLAGNIIGGSFIFALISHAQIRNDMDVQRQGRPALVPEPVADLICAGFRAAAPLMSHVGGLLHYIDYGLPHLTRLSCPNHGKNSSDQSSLVP